MAVKCANTSSLPSSGAMNPKPLSALNHLTVPVAMSYSSWRIVTHDFRERLSRRTSNLREELDTPRGTQIHSYGQRRATASTLLHRSHIWESDRADGLKNPHEDCGGEPGQGVQKNVRASTASRPTGRISWCRSTRTPASRSSCGSTTSPMWNLDGFSIVAATTSQDFDNYYVMGRRSYVSYDKYLLTGPYNFGFLNTKPDWVEHYKYGHGLLISYWDTSMNDNNTSLHPGSGRNLPIDANPRPIINVATGAPWRARIQMYDAPFSLHTADSMTLHTNGKPSYIRGQSAQPLFDDTKKYWYATLPNHGVKLPAVGVQVKVLEENGTSLTVRFN